MGFLDRVEAMDSDMISKVFGVVAGLTVVMPATKSLILKPISNWCLGGPMEKKDLKATMALEEKREKFLTSGWKLISYIFFLVIGFWAIQTEQYWFWDPYTYHLPYPEGKVPSRIMAFYALETGYYIYSTFAVFFEPKMKDRAQMFVHHIFTTFLLVSSYLGNTTKFGVPIMLLHDVADPPMEFAKLCIYTGYESVANIFFIVFTGVFIFFRDYVFPRHIIYPILWLTTQHYYKYAVPTVASLVGLWVLHIIWTYMIFQVISKTILNGKIEDVREEN